MKGDDAWAWNGPDRRPRSSLRTAVWFGWQLRNAAKKHVSSSLQDVMLQRPLLGTAGRVGRDECAGVK
jgi:hypothetical protein